MAADFHVTPIINRTGYTVLSSFAPSGEQRGGSLSLKQERA
ncbi:MAG: hypothetical protein PQJ60_05760 [Spirochaetales bacterium]|nr:hypothetical protein [Spirochaetales bacterium]